MTAMSGRVASALLGFWLVVSALLWPQSPLEFTNALLVGVAVLLGGLAMIEGEGWGYYLTAVCGVWLMGSTLFLTPAVSGQFWNHLITGLGLVATSLAPQPVPASPRRRVIATPR
jgi:hypothetical protein